MQRILTICTAAFTLTLVGVAHGAPPTFSARVTNQWLPLAPGARYVYKGIKDGQPEREVVTVLHRTQTIAGKPCAVVETRRFVYGKLRELSTDWYSQDSAGTVWYYGQRTERFDTNGLVTGTDTWLAGAGGARAGIFMPAHPRAGQSGWQNHAPGQAEDRFEVLSLLGTNEVLMQESTPLDPGVIDHKIYVRGIGMVFDQAASGGNEHTELVAFTPSS